MPVDGTFRKTRLEKGQGGGEVSVYSYFDVECCLSSRLIFKMNRSADSTERWQLGAA